MLFGVVGRVGFQWCFGEFSRFLVVFVEIGHWTPLVGRVGVGVLDTHLMLLVC